VTSYDIERRQPYFFKSFKAREEPDTRDCPMWQAARATSAAPTYFEPFKLETGDRLEYRVLVDGGVFANNPALCAYAEAQSLNRGSHDEEYLVLSLGTGELTRRFRYEDAKDWGLIGWARPVLDLVFDGVSDAVDYQMRKLLEEFKDPTQYYRFQGELTHANDDMDDASERNIRDLRLLAGSLIENHHREIDQLCDRLSRIAASRAGGPGNLPDDRVPTTGSRIPGIANRRLHQYS
jgi:predicted acylesterase/phospholipase RssA